MEDNSIVENIDLIQYALKRPSIFSITNVESYFVFFKGYSIGKKDSVIFDFFESFAVFVYKKHSEECLRNIEVEKIIRLYSSNDSHSLKLLSIWVVEFVQESTLYNIREF